MDQFPVEIAIVLLEQGLELEDLPVLIWDGDIPCRQGSSLGLRLSQALKEFGLINHNVWKDRTPALDRR